jgi:K+/H+ antiporter YhaU regulatory subunit KhtT
MIDDIDEERMYVVIPIRKSTARKLDALLNEVKRYNRNVETLSDLLELLIELYREVQELSESSTTRFLTLISSSSFGG